MIPGNLAKRYARALLELADSPMKRDRFEKDLNSLAATSHVPDETGTPLALTLDAGRYPLSQRRALGAAICKRLMADPTVTKFLDLVVERGRASGLPQIAMQYAELADAQAGRVRATVTAATPVGPGALAQVKTALEGATGKKVLLEQEVDPELIGGVVTQVGSYRLDRSVKTMLEQMRSGLKQGA